MCPPMRRLGQQLHGGGTTSEQRGLRLRKGSGRMLVQSRPASSNRLLGSGTSLVSLPGGGATTVCCFREPHLLGGPGRLLTAAVARQLGAALAGLLASVLPVLAPLISRSFP